MQTDYIDLATKIVAISSLAHTLLPPWDGFEDFPTLQRYYKLFIYIIGYMALNGRSTVYKKISLEQQVNGVLNNNNSTNKELKP